MSGRRRGYKGAVVHAAMVSLIEWLIKNVPFSFDLAMDHHAELATRPLDDVLHDLRSLRYGCMCGGLATLLAHMAKRQGYDAVQLNFGEEASGISHVVVLVDVGHRRRVIYDPTLGYFSAKADGTPASIYTVIDFLRGDLRTGLHLAEIGPRERPVLFRSGTTPPASLTSPIRRLDDVRSWAMMDIDAYAAASWGTFFQAARRRNPALTSLFDCLRFPISTSGEPETEAIAHQLRALK